MKVTLELGKAIGMAQVCWKSHDFEFQRREGWPKDRMVWFCKKCGAVIKA